MHSELPQSPLPLRWLYVDFNSFFASVEQQLNPRLRGRPVMVIPVDTETTCAIAASYEAKAYGIKTNTPVYEARRLCPEVVCVVGDHRHYVDYHNRILNELENHLPVDAVCSIDEMASRLMDNENSDTRVAEIARGIKAGLVRNVGECIRCSIGVSTNRFLAKVATDMQKPDGFTILHQHDLPHRLFELKLRDIPGIGRNMERRILLAGINDMRGLMALSATEMRRIWGGAWGERMWFLLRGADLPEIETHRSSVGHSHVLAPDLRVPYRARHVARRLTLKAAARLRRMGYYASALSFSARLEDGPRVEGSAQCHRAQDSLTFLHMLDAIWQQVIEVRAGRVSQALDKINHRFGRDSVTLGIMPADGRSFSGTKVAFTRIPDVAEFVE